MALATLITGLPALVLLMVTGFVGLIMTVVASNTGAAVLMMPMVLVTTCGVSLDFILPVGTPPSALAYSTGQIRTDEMARAGLVLTVFVILVPALYAYWVFWLRRVDAGHLQQRRPQPGDQRWWVAWTPSDDTADWCLITRIAGKDRIDDGFGRWTTDGGRWTAARGGLTGSPDRCTVVLSFMRARSTGVVGARRSYAPGRAFGSRRCYRFLVPFVLLSST